MPFHMLVRLCSKSQVVCEPRTSRWAIWVQKRQRNQRSNCQHLLGHRESKVISEKTSTTALLTTLKALIMWITTNCGKFLKRWGVQAGPRWEYQTILLVPEKTVYSSRSNNQNQIQNNRLSQNQERSMTKLYIVFLLI